MSAAHYLLLAARLAQLVRTDPLAFDGPGAEALVVWVIASKMAMFDQAAACVAAMEVDHLVLAKVSPVSDHLNLSAADLTHSWKIAGG